MNDDIQRQPDQLDGRDTYSPPTVETLGTLTELTRGGAVGPGDGFGSAGSNGSI